MKLETLHDLYVLELKDLYSAEQQIVKALPKIIDKASSPELRRALEIHLEQSRIHGERLEQIFEMHGESPRALKCRGMQGLLDEGSELFSYEASGAVRDAAIISTCQRVEHYEVAAYGTLRTYARQLGHDRAAAILQETLEEEVAADAKLTSIANRRVNIEATRTA
jgi:ferritin-like metal-binding protein YciE